MEIGFEEDLEYKWEHLSLGTHGLFEELGRHDKEGGSQESHNCGAYKESIEHVLFDCTSYMYDSSGLDFLEYLKMILPPNVFDSIFDTPAFLKEKWKVHVCW